MNNETGRETATIPAGEGEGEWDAMRFEYNITYYATGDAPHIERLPFSATVPPGQGLIDSTLPVTQMERRGRTPSWLNIAPGALGLVFNNYCRVLNETVEIGSGDMLFGHWLINSFLTAAGRIVMILTLATSAGYALARLKFRGSAAVFSAVIFSMTIPPKVTFISNYLVIRDMGLSNQGGGGESDWGLVLASALISVIPLVVMFILFQRYIIYNQVTEGIK